jgi:3-oxoacyl-(acyl-carrier-protein) synthase
MKDSISLAAGAWIIGSFYGTLHSHGARELPSIEDLFLKVPARTGRFDLFTRLVFAAVGLTLQEAAEINSPLPDKAGLIISTHHGVMQTDLDYYATTIEQDGLLASPNLFSYTLPVAVIGECASFFHLTGPTFTIGSDDRQGLNAPEMGLLLLQARQAQSIIAVWVEAPPEMDQAQMKPSAAAVLLKRSSAVGIYEESVEKIMKDKNVQSLFSLFPLLRGGEMPI